MCNCSKGTTLQCQSSENKNEAPKIFAPPGKVSWTLFKIIGHSLKIWAPLRKLFATHGVPSWLRAYAY